MLKLLLTLIALVGLCACQAGGGKSGGSAPGPTAKGGSSPPPPVVDTLGGNGGTHSGGGQSVRGKTLESYNFKVRSSNEYKTIVLPLIQELAKHQPKLASALVHIARERVWYRVPVDLDAIDQRRLGVSFQTSQIARQNLGEIWIDDNKYKALESDEERAMLVFHEMVMGVFFMKYQDGLDECLASVAIYDVIDVANAKYGDLRDGCFKRYSKRVLGFEFGGPKSRQIDLRDEDNIAIRDFGVRLFTSGGNLSTAEIEGFMTAKGFPDYSLKDQSRTSGQP